MGAAGRHSCCARQRQDLPFVTADLFRRLLALRQEAVPDAIVPLQSDGIPQPLCALYRTATCLQLARQAIAAGAHSPRALLDQVATRYVEFQTLADLPRAAHFFFNVNTPENFAEAQVIAAQID